MHNDIVVYRLLSETDEPDMNISYQTAMAMVKMGIIYHSLEDYQVIREGNTTVTVYSHRKV